MLSPVSYLLTPAIYAQAKILASKILKCQFIKVPVDGA